MLLLLCLRVISISVVVDVDFVAGSYCNTFVVDVATSTVFVVSDAIVAGSCYSGC